MEAFKELQSTPFGPVKINSTSYGACFRENLRRGIFNTFAEKGRFRLYCVTIKHIIFPRQFYTDAGLQEKLLTLLRYIITQPFNILGDLNVNQSFNRSTKGRRLVRMEHQRYELFLTPPPPLTKVLNSFFFNFLS